MLSDVFGQDRITAFIILFSNSFVCIPTVALFR